MPAKRSLKLSRMVLGLVLLLVLALASEPAVVFVVMKSATLLGQMNDIPVQLRVLNRK
jgi:hypothetical protein